MPRPKPQTPPIVYRLLSEDQSRLDAICLVEKRNRADVTREAVLWYLDHREKLVEDMRESKVEKRIKHMEDRLASLLSKANLDLGTLVQIMFNKMGGTEAEKTEVFKKARRQSIKRLRTKLQDESEIAEVYKQDMDPEKVEVLAP